MSDVESDLWSKMIFILISKYFFYKPRVEGAAPNSTHCNPEAYFINPFQKITDLKKIINEALLVIFLS